MKKFSRGIALQIIPKCTNSYFQLDFRGFLTWDSLIMLLYAVIIEVKALVKVRAFSSSGFSIILQIRQKWGESNKKLQSLADVLPTKVLEKNPLP